MEGEGQGGEGRRANSGRAGAKASLLGGGDGDGDDGEEIANTYYVVSDEFSRRAAGSLKMQTWSDSENSNDQEDSSESSDDEADMRLQLLQPGDTMKELESLDYDTIDNMIHNLKFTSRTKKVTYGCF